MELIANESVTGPGNREMIVRDVMKNTISFMIRSVQPSKAV